MKGECKTENLKKKESIYIIVFSMLWLLLGLESFVIHFVAFVIGVIVGRIASIVISKFLRFIKFIEFANYKEYVAASKKDSRIETLLMNANFYRNILSTVILIFWLKMVVVLGINLNVLKHIILSIILVIFLFAFRKEEKNITGRVNINKVEENSNIIMENV